MTTEEIISMTRQLIIDGRLEGKKISFTFSYGERIASDFRLYGDDDVRCSNFYVNRGHANEGIFSCLKKEWLDAFALRVMDEVVDKNLF